MAFISFMLFSVQFSFTSYTVSFSGAMGGVIYLYWKVYESKESSNPCNADDADTIDFNNIDPDMLVNSYGPAVIVSAR